MPQQNPGTSASGSRGFGLLLGLALVAAAFALKSCSVVVPAGHRGVVFSRARKGVLHKSLGEGWHLYMPFDQSVDLFDVRSQSLTSGAQTYAGEINGGDPVDATSRDGQRVILDLTLRYHVDAESVWWIRENVGTDVLKIIKPELRAHARDVVAGESGIDVYSRHRRAIQQAIKERLTNPKTSKLAANHIIVEDLLLRDTRFSADFQAAIERKQIAMQTAQRMAYVLDKARKEKQRRIIEATGESQAMSLKAQALAAYPELVKYEYVQKLPDDLKVVVADSKTIISLSDLLPSAPPAPKPGR
jgi:prohibitin 2